MLYNRNYIPQQSLKIQGQPSVHTCTESACQEYICLTGNQWCADISSVTVGQTNMSPALDVSLLSFTSIVGPVSCLTQRGRCWQDGERFSNACALSARADVVPAHSLSYTHTYMQMFVYAHPGSFRAALCCPLFIISQKTARAKYSLLKVFSIKGLRCCACILLWPLCIFVAFLSRLAVIVFVL